MRDQKGFTPIILILGLLILAMIGVGAYFLIKPSFFSNNKVQNSQWKTIESKACYVSLDYPIDWKEELTENGQYCEFKITNPSDSNWRFSFTNASLYTPTSGDLLNERKPDAVDITIDGIKGYRQLLTGDNRTVNTEIVAVLKGEMPFFAHLVYDPKDKQTVDIYNKVIASIKFTGQSDQYKVATKVSKEGFQKKVEDQARDQSLKANAYSLQIMVDNYKKQMGNYPTDLNSLKSSEDYNAWLNNVTNTKTTVADYVYQLNADSYMISVTLSDGSIYKLPL